MFVAAFFAVTFPVLFSVCTKPFCSLNLNSMSCVIPDQWLQLFFPRESAGGTRTQACLPGRRHFNAICTAMRPVKLIKTKQNIKNPKTRRQRSIHKNAARQQPNQQNSAYLSTERHTIRPFNNDQRRKDDAVHWSNGESC